MGLPSQRTSPAAGASRPHRMRRRLVLPRPLAPATRSSSPPRSANERPRKSILPPRSHWRSAAWSTAAIVTETATASRRRSVQVEGVALERRERRVLGDVLVGRFEHDARRLAGLPGLDPAQDMQTPAVAGLQAAEA